MGGEMKKWLKKYPLTSFYSLAFLITWLAWIPQMLYSRGQFPFDHFVFYVIGGVGPMLAAYFVLSAEYGKNEATSRLFKPLFSWKRSTLLYIYLFVLIMPLVLLPLVLNQKTIQLSISLSTSIYSFATYFIAAIPEELAWRGFALPRLQRHHSALFSSIIVGILWGLWHFPLLFNLNSLMSDYNRAAWFLDTLAQSVVYVWLFNSTKGSVFMLVFFHAIMNQSGHFYGWLSTIITASVALVLIIVYGPATLSADSEKVVK